MATLDFAVKLATERHSGQVDRGGAPYIDHPLRVMANVETEEEKIVAVLHDVLEDTPTTPKELADFGFSSNVIQAIQSLTKLNGEDRFKAAYRTAKNRIAIKVKLADLADNMDLSRLKNVTAKDRARLLEYQKVHLILKHALEDILESKDTLGERIRWIRGKESRRIFAERFDITPGTLQRYESNERLPELSTLLKLCELTGYSLDFLVFGKEPSITDSENIILRQYRKSAVIIQNKILLLFLANDLASEMKVEPIERELA